MVYQCFLFIWYAEKYCLLLSNFNISSSLLCKLMITISLSKFNLRLDALIFVISKYHFLVSLHLAIALLGYLSHKNSSSS